MLRIGIVALTLFASVPPAAVKVDDTCIDYVDTHVLIRNDVADTLNKDSLKLESCTAHLKGAQDDLAKLQAHVESLEGIIQIYKDREDVLTKHVEELRADPTWIEDYDGPTGLLLGWSVGMGQCIGLAWVFNQPAFGG